MVSKNAFTVVISYELDMREAFSETYRLSRKSSESENFGSNPNLCPRVFRKRKKMMFPVKSVELYIQVLQTKTVSGQAHENQQVYM